MIDTEACYSIKGLQWGFCDMWGGFILIGHCN